MKISGGQAYLLTWGGIGLLAVGAVYVAVKYILPGFAKGASSGLADTFNGLLEGFSHNSLTKGGPAEGFGGDYNYEYGGFGPLSTLGAGANKLTGGLAADAGEGLGDHLFSWLNPNADTGSSVTYITTFPDGSRHAVDSNGVDSNGRFSYAGETFQLGDDGSGRKIAVRLSTIYGSGAG